MALRPSHSQAQGKVIHCVTRDINDRGEENVFRMDNDHSVPERRSKTLRRRVKSEICSRGVFYEWVLVIYWTKAGFIAQDNFIIERKRIIIYSEGVLVLVSFTFNPSYFTGCGFSYETVEWHAPPRILYFESAGSGSST